MTIKFARDTFSFIHFIYENYRHVLVSLSSLYSCVAQTGNKFAHSTKLSNVSHTVPFLPQVYQESLSFSDILLLLFTEKGAHSIFIFK